MILIGAMLGNASSVERASIDCQVNESLSTGVRMFVAVISLPSGMTPVASGSQRLPCQRPGRLAEAAVAAEQPRRRPPSAGPCRSSAWRSRCGPSP